MAGVKLDFSADRENVMHTAGNKYETKNEEILGLTSGQDAGNLGTLMRAQLGLTHAEIALSVESGTATKVAKQVTQASQAIKQ